MLAYVELVQRKEKEIGCDVLTHQKWFASFSLFFSPNILSTFMIQERCPLPRFNNPDCICGIVEHVRYWEGLDRT